MANRGQSKMHLVRDASGNEFEMSQEEWRGRDKSLGLERVDETAEVAPTEEAPAAPAEGEGSGEGTPVG